jgi:hypothetical protein
METYDILHIILQNSDVNDPKFLGNIAVISKHYNNIVQDIWKTLKAPNKTSIYENNICTICKKTREINNFGECYCCTNRLDNILLDEYDAMQLWNLESYDLNNLVYINGMNSIIKKRTKFFKEKDVIIASIYKHTSSERLYYILQLNDKQRKRYYKVTDIIKIEMKTMLWVRYIEPFIKTGKGGLKKLLEDIHKHEREPCANIRWYVG